MLVEPHTRYCRAPARVGSGTGAPLLAKSIDFVSTGVAIGLQFLILVSQGWTTPGKETCPGETHDVDTKEVIDVAKVRHRKLGLEGGDNRV